MSTLISPATKMFIISKRDFEHLGPERFLWAQSIFLQSHAHYKTSSTKVAFQTITVESIAEQAEDGIALHEDRMLAMQECLGKLDC